MHANTGMHSALPTGDPVATGRRLILGPDPKFGKLCHRETVWQLDKRIRKTRLDTGQVFPFCARTTSFLRQVKNKNKKQNAKV